MPDMPIFLPGLALYQAIEEMDSQKEVRMGDAQWSQ